MTKQIRHTARSKTTNPSNQPSKANRDPFALTKRLLKPFGVADPPATLRFVALGKKRDRQRSKQTHHARLVQDIQQTASQGTVDARLLPVERAGSEEPGKLGDSKTTKKRKGRSSRGEKTSRSRLNAMGLGRYLRGHVVPQERLAPLTTLFHDYVRSLDPLAASHLPRLSYLGAPLTVTRSICPTLVRKSGIVVQESQHAFRLAQTDRTVQVPKHGCEFEVDLGNGMTGTLYGDRLGWKPEEKARKKLSQRRTALELGTARIGRGVA